MAGDVRGGPLLLVLLEFRSVPGNGTMRRAAGLRGLFEKGPQKGGGRTPPIDLPGSPSTDPCLTSFPANLTT